MPDAGKLLERLVEAERAAPVDEAGRERSLAAIHAAIAAGRTPVVDVPPSASILQRPIWPWLLLAALILGAAAWWWLRPPPPTVETEPALRAAAEFKEQPRQAPAPEADPQPSPLPQAEEAPQAAPEPRPVLQADDAPATPVPQPKRDSKPPSELEMIKRANAALRRGDHADARKALDAHARHYRSGSLAQEREALRAVLACHSGNPAQAQRFLAAHPQSPHVDRIRSACALP